MVRALFLDGMAMVTSGVVSTEWGVLFMDHQQWLSAGKEGTDPKARVTGCRRPPDPFLDTLGFGLKGLFQKRLQFAFCPHRAQDIGVAIKPGVDKDFGQCGPVGHFR